MKPLSSTTVSSILSLLDSGINVREIKGRTGISIGSISKIRNEHRPNLPKELGGHPRKLSGADLRHVLRFRWKEFADRRRQRASSEGRVGWSRMRQ
jgi:transposase